MTSGRITALSALLIVSAMGASEARPVAIAEFQDQRDIVQLKSICEHALGRCIGAKRADRPRPVILPASVANGINRRDLLSEAIIVSNFEEFELGIEELVAMTEGEQPAGDIPQVPLPLAGVLFLTGLGGLALSRAVPKKNLKAVVSR